jgi:hypothetical protein
MKLNGIFSTTKNNHQEPSCLDRRPTCSIGAKQPLFSWQSERRQAAPALEHVFPVSGMKPPRSLSRTQHELLIAGLPVRSLVQRRTPDGSLVSVRIPVTRSNRRLLRILRAAELAAWEAAGHGAE